MEDIQETFEHYFEKVEQQRKELQKRIVGMQNLINTLFTCFYTQDSMGLLPHLLVEGTVGAGKTTLLKTFTKTISGVTFKRIQFTADLRPLDLLRIVKQREDRTLEYRNGPLFANLVLADEINRAQGQTLATLLEAMAEGQITLEGETTKLDRPFFVMATQNPLEHQGTYEIGRAAIDRFMAQEISDTLTEEEAIKLNSEHDREGPEIKPILDKGEVLHIREFISQHVIIAPEIREDIVKVVRALWPGKGVIESKYEDLAILPTGERGHIFLSRGAKAHAFLAHRNYVTPDDFTSIAIPILRHRILFQTLSYRESQEKAEEVIKKSHREGD